MNNQLITQLQDNFNSLAYQIEDSTIEYWYARDLQKILDYERWDKFKNVIDKAKITCENSGVNVSDHFRQVGKMVQNSNVRNILLERGINPEHFPAL